MIWIVGRGIYALNYIRFLSFSVNLITSDKYDFASVSKYVNLVYYVPFNSLYCANVERIVKNDFVVAIGEETLFLDEYIKKTNSQMNLFAYSDLRLEFHNKEKFTKLIKNIDLPTIKTWYAQEQIVNPNPDIKYLEKKTKSRGGLGQKIIKLNTGTKYFVKSGYIVQEYLSDKQDYSIFVIAREGNVLHYTAYKCSNMINGYATFRQQVDNSELFTQTKKIISEIKYSGFLGLDFIFSNGIYYVVDFNPRITNGISLIQNKISISTLPYLIKDFSLKNIVKAFVFSDIFSLRDPIPFFYMGFVFVQLFVFALFKFKNPFTYIKSHIESSIVKYD